MSHTPHELAEEFPDKVALIHDLKMKDGEFRHLFDQYHEINRAIHRFETNVEPVAPYREEELKMERVYLKDCIAKKLRDAAQA